MKREGWSERRLIWVFCGNEERRKEAQKIFLHKRGMCMVEMRRLTIERHMGIS
jgi:hypothetical protein